MAPITLTCSHCRRVLIASHDPQVRADLQCPVCRSWKRWVPQSNRLGYSVKRRVRGQGVKILEEIQVYAVAVEPDP